MIVLICIFRAPCSGVQSTSSFPARRLLDVTKTREQRLRVARLSYAKQISSSQSIHLNPIGVCKQKIRENSAWRWTIALESTFPASFVVLKKCKFPSISREIPFVLISSINSFWRLWYWISFLFFLASLDCDSEAERRKNEAVKGNNSDRIDFTFTEWCGR